MIIVYQSLNSGNQSVGTDKADGSAVNSYFTSKAHTAYSDQFQMITSSSSSPHTAYSGLYPTAEPMSEGSAGDTVNLSACSRPLAAGIEKNIDLVSCVIEQILLETSQYGKPAIIVLGEICLKSTGRQDYIVANIYDNKRACQSFTVLIHAKLNASITLGESSSKPSYPILTCNGIRIAFVHIPNEYKADINGAANFLADAKNNVDIIMGDTNFKSAKMLQDLGVKVWGSEYSTFPFETAKKSTLHPGPQGMGTNSNETEPFDQGISRIPGSNFGESIVNYAKGFQGPQPAFQFLGVLSKRILVGGEAVTFSDHNGLVINIIDPVLPSSSYCSHTLPIIDSIEKEKRLIPSNTFINTDVQFMIDRLQIRRSECLRILGLNENTYSTLHLPKIFRTLAKLHHPDKGGSEAKFKSIHEAYIDLPEIDQLIDDLKQGKKIDLRSEKLQKFISGYQSKLAIACSKRRRYNPY